MVTLEGPGSGNPTAPPHRGHKPLVISLLEVVRPSTGMALIVLIFCSRTACVTS
jgi:hypothetical protein